MRKAHQDLRDKFIGVIEKDMHGSQNCVYKELRLLNEKEKDGYILFTWLLPSLHVTDDSDCRKNYMKLLCEDIA